VRLSREHVEIAWLTHGEALARLTWDSNRHALWELHERLTDPEVWPAPAANPATATDHGPDVWQMLQDLVDTSQIVVDRPAGSAHPRFPDLVYPLDYGYLDGTRGGDGDGIDCWLGGAGTHIVGVFLTVDPRKRDAEIKVLLGCSPDQIHALRQFHRPRPQRALFVPRSPTGATSRL